MKRHRGLTLLEIMMAIAVTSLAVLSVLALQTYLSRAQTQSSIRYEASVVATSLMVEAKQDLKADFQSSIDRPRAEVPDEFDADLELQYTVTEEDVVYDSDGAAVLKEISITVHWDKQGEKSYKLWTKVAAP